MQNASPFGLASVSGWCLHQSQQGITSTQHGPPTQQNPAADAVPTIASNSRTDVSVSFFIIFSNFIESCITYGSAAWRWQFGRGVYTKGQGGKGGPDDLARIFHPGQGWGQGNHRAARPRYAAVQLATGVHRGAAQATRPTRNGVGRYDHRQAQQQGCDQPEHIRSAPFRHPAVYL